MEHTNSLLYNLVRALKRYPDSEPNPSHQSVKEFMHISCEVVPDFLLYLMEGVLPMLKV